MLFLHKHCGLKTDLQLLRSVVRFLRVVVFVLQLLVCDLLANYHYQSLEVWPACYENPCTYTLPNPPVLCPYCTTTSCIYAYSSCWCAYIYCRSILVCLYVYPCAWVHTQEGKKLEHSRSTLCLHSCTLLHPLQIRSNLGFCFVSSCCQSLSCDFWLLPSILLCLFLSFHLPSSVIS